MAMFAGQCRPVVSGHVVSGSNLTNPGEAFAYLPVTTPGISEVRGQQAVRKYKFVKIQILIYKDL
jgi:hypothetical protein